MPEKLDIKLAPSRNSSRNTYLEGTISRNPSKDKVTFQEESRSRSPSKDSSSKPVSHLGFQKRDRAVVLAQRRSQLSLKKRHQFKLNGDKAEMTLFDSFVAENSRGRSVKSLLKTEEAEQKSQSPPASQ